jgi:hypothetical protein
VVALLSSPLERLRKAWSPGSEIEETVAELDPGSELDSMIRDWLHRVCEQNGPQKVVLGVGGDLRLNTGTLRFEIVHFEPSPGSSGQRELTIWVEDAEVSPPLVPGGLLDKLYPSNRTERRRRR